MANGTPEKMLDYLVMFELERFDGESQYYDYVNYPLQHEGGVRLSKIHF